jgi:hypothetical protein
MNNLTFLIIVTCNALGLIAVVKKLYWPVLVYAIYLTIVTCWLYLSCYFSLYIFIPALVSIKMATIAYPYAKILILRKSKPSIFGIVTDGIQNNAMNCTVDRMQAQPIQMETRAEPQLSSNYNSHSIMNMNPVYANPRIP